MKRKIEEEKEEYNNYKAYINYSKTNNLKRLYIYEYSLLRKDHNDYGYSYYRGFDKIDKLKIINIIDYDYIILKNSEIPFEFDIIQLEDSIKFTVEEEKDDSLEEENINRTIDLDALLQQYYFLSTINLYSARDNIIDRESLYITKFTFMLIRNRLKNQLIINIPRFVIIKLLNFIELDNLLDHFKIWKNKQEYITIKNKNKTI